MGEYDVSSIKEPVLHEERHVAQVIVHPDFDNKTLTNDIAMLRLKVPADKKSNIDIVCMPETNRTFSSSNTCYITGWGRRSEGKHLLLVIEIRFILLITNCLFYHYKNSIN